MSVAPFCDHRSGRLHGLAPELVLALPQEWRNRLLHYIRLWGDPEQHLAIVTTLRDVEGAPLAMLDLEAHSLAAAGSHAQALEVIGRRIRRSPAIAALAFELELLQSAGHAEHARHTADELLRTYPEDVRIVTAGAAVLAGAGHFSYAQELLETLAAAKPGDMRVHLALARLALAAGKLALADQYAQRLGAGVPPGISDDDLVALSALHQDLSSTESAAAAQAELERRRRQQLSALCTVLDPLSELPPGELAQSSQLYDHAYQAWSGLGSITVSDRERRAITLEAVRHFGFSELREGQAETISTVLHDESILVVMPTGAGKSLCYQLPALMDSGATLVISPLIALMKDQVENLPVADRRRATFINSSLTDEQMDQRMQGVAEGRYKLVYAAPERLRHLAFLRALRDAGVSLFVVDEAHCVSLWGHDFRPDYLFLQAARAELGNPPALAITATAPPRVRDEIIGYIGDPDEAQVAPPPGEEPDGEQAGGRVRVLALDVFRDNLHLSALQFNNEDEKLAAVTSFAVATPGPGIVYVNSRRKCESLAYALRQAGVDAEAYHAGLDNRAEIQDRFMSGATRVIVATIAFGMGIDKADIRFIVHFHPARSLAAYYQEVGRAGRDGKPSQGILFYGNNDWSNLRRWAKADEHSVEFLAQVYTAVASQLGVTVDDAAFAAGPANTAAGAGVPAPESSSGPVDANRLQAVLDADETSVRVAVSMLERVGLLYRGFDIPETAEIERPSRAPQGQPPGKEFSRLVGGLNLRAGEKASFKLADIAAFMKWPLAGAESQLLELAREGALTVRFEHRHMLIHLAPAPADIRSRLQRLLDHNAAVGQRRIDDVIGYATTQGCRHGTISAHLGSRPIASCDVCDNCTGMRPNIPEPEILPELDLSDSELSAIIVDCLLSLPKAVGRHGLARVLVGALRAPVPAEESRHFGALRSLGQDAVVQSIDELLADGRLRQYDRNGYPLLSATLSGRTLAGSWQEAHPQPALDPEELAAPGSAQPSAAAENERRELDAATPEDDAPTGDAPAREVRYTKLQTAIWSWRRRTAAQQHRPVYTIMDNDMIRLIGEARPASLEELAAIPGIGAQRLERYGPVLLDLIRLHPPDDGDEQILAAQRSQPGVEEAGGPGKQTRSAERAIYLKLQEIRQRQAVTEGCRPAQVAAAGLLRAISKVAPTTHEQLLAVAGFRSSGLTAQTETIVQSIRDVLRSEGGGA